MTKLGLSIISAIGLVATSASAEPLTTNSVNLFGTPGLIEMPTAESAPDANLTGTFAMFGDDTRATLSFQLTPRLSGSFRYARLPGFNQNNNTTRFDRSFDIKYQFWDESRLLPAVAIGLRDFVGTGVYSGEYIVATKSVGKKLRFSAGVGWGRLGSFEPVASIGNRPNVNIGRGGTTNAPQWFRGDFAPFGGVVYTPNKRLTFKAEYSSDAYTYEVQEGLIDRKSPWNFGAEYAFKNGVRVGGSYTYGDRFGLQVSFAANPTKSRTGPGNENAPLPVAPRPARASNPSAYDLGWVVEPSRQPAIRTTIADALFREGIIAEAIALDTTRVELRIRNTTYQSEAQALGRTARLLTRALPASVETIVLTLVTDGVPKSTVTFQRSDIEALENAPADAMLQRAVFSDAAGLKNPNLVATPGIYPKFTWNLSPYLEASFFDPDAPVRGDTGLRLAARYDVAPGLVLAGSVKHRLAGNLDDISRRSNSVLPRVRSDIDQYLIQGTTALEYLTLSHFARPDQNLYSRITVGYLERMYGGISTELLWKPVDSRLALGAEVNFVRQRAFDGGLEFRNYETFTGHVSAYYDFGNGYHAQLDVGQYLAQDQGATISFDREFANGWKVGAFATFTDVSFEDFGEGSFDKGIRLSIPISWATGQPSKRVASTTIRPLTRDGGARLSVNDRLYERVRGSHQPDVANSWGRFWR